MAVRWSDAPIATTLNRIGLTTGQGNTWNAKRVASRRREAAIAGPAPEMLCLTMMEAAVVAREVRADDLRPVLHVLVAGGIGQSPRVNPPEEYGGSVMTASTQALGSSRSAANASPCTSAQGARPAAALGRAVDLPPIAPSAEVHDGATIIANTLNLPKIVHPPAHDRRELGPANVPCDNGVVVRVHPRRPRARS